MTAAMVPTASNRQPGHEQFDPPPLLLLQIQQHDDKQEQDDDRPGIDQHLHRRQEEGVQQHKKPGQRNNGQDQEHGAGHRVAADRVGDDQRPAQQRQPRKNIKENVLHSYLCFHFQIWS